mgnify:CR=1 FL=1
MNKFIYIFVAIAAISFVSCTQERAKEKELKVLSWNVWHAGHAKNYPEKGCEGTIGILRKSQADVILMMRLMVRLQWLQTLWDMITYCYQTICVFIVAIRLKNISFP